MQKNMSYLSSKQVFVKMQMRHTRSTSLLERQLISKYKIDTSQYNNNNNKEGRETKATTFENWRWSTGKDEIVGVVCAKCQRFTGALQSIHLKELIDSVSETKFDPSSSILFRIT